jgi:hypothetical protein
MTSPDHELPPTTAIADAITPLVAPATDGISSVRVVVRRPNAYSSSSPAEIVTIAFADGRQRELFLKYAREPDPEPRCRQGIAYCGRVYDQLVQRLPLPTVRSLGLVTIGHPPVQALVLEHLQECLRVNEAPDESGLMAAAAWCGRMHSWGSAADADPAFGFLTRYTADSCRAWSQRARSLAASVGGVPDWLARACGTFHDRVIALVAMERTTIHGDFGPQNVLWKDGVVRPVDWESAAIGPGVIDLATLLFDWPAETVGRGIEAYWQARRAEMPTDFPAVFATATVSAALRWLPVPADGHDRRWRDGLDRLERAATAAGSS